MFTVFAILFFTIYWRINMFSKIKELHKSKMNQKGVIVVDIHHNGSTDNSITIASFLNKNRESGDDSSFYDSVSKNTTFIASNMTINGNIIANGTVYVLGRVNGNINVIDGTINIIKDGIVKGNFVAKNLISDGCSEGKIIASDIIVLENGHIKGCVIYDSLSIRPSGIIDGKTSLRKKK